MEPVKFKSLLSVAILTVGAFLVLLVGTGMSASAYQATGVAVDFGDRDVVWTDVDLNMYSNPVDALEYVCNENSYTYTIGPDGNVSEINGLTAGERTWDLWVVNNGETTWTKLSAPYNIDLRNYSANVWAYCSSSEQPTVGVDQAGRSIYGYAQCDRSVSLSPSITEIIGALDAVTTLVGADKYSDYPASVIEGENRGDITIIGDYVNPSYELIMGTNPDMVFCDGSQYSHYEMSEKLRKSNVNSIVLYSGESIETILDNIYIVGVAMGYELRALDVISTLESTQKQIVEYLQSKQTQPGSVLLTLSSERSPWASGSYTYINDIAAAVFGDNVIDAKYDGWVQINSEIIAQSNPSVIIILSGDYHATQSDYDAMLNSLSGEWKTTDAYKNGNIYLMGDSLGEMAGRAGPRYTQLMEIVAMMLHPDAFNAFPKYIGDDYRNYLTFTNDIGF